MCGRVAGATQVAIVASATSWAHLVVLVGEASGALCLGFQLASQVALHEINCYEVRTGNEDCN